MAQDKKQEPDQQEKQGVRNRHTDTSPQKNTVDLASINAMATNESGEFVREGKKDEYRKNTTKQQVQTSIAATKKTSEKNKENKKEYAVPVLRTYQQDTRHIAQTKGGAELRTILAKEAEEKRNAQKEYIRNTKDIMKESVVLRDRYKNFIQEKKKEGVGTSAQKAPVASTDAKSIDKENIVRTLSGATTYMQSAQDTAKKQQRELSRQFTSNASTPSAKEQSKPTAYAETFDTKPEKISEKPSDQTEENKGIFARIRGRVLPKDVFTEERRESLKQKQQEVVEKGAIQDAWKDFKQKKKRLQQMGLQARDVRSYTTSPDEEIPNKPLRRQNMLLLAIVFFLLTGLLSSIVFLALSPAEKPISNSNEASDTLPVSDVISSESQVFVDTTDTIALSDTWPSITKKDGEQDTVVKYVPYKPTEGKELQISFKDFSDTFNVRFPFGLQNAFDDYYFVGKYLTQTEANGIFIASVKKYGDAFVWIRNWEKNAINAFSAVFSNSFQQSKTSNVTAESRIIDNQDVRVIRNPSSQKELFYYFFGRSILVFVVGEESAIPLINARIRSTNTL